MKFVGCVKEGDTFTLSYTRMVEDIHGAEFEILAERHTRLRSDVEAEIAAREAQIASYQQNLALLQEQLAEIIKAGG